MSGIWGTSTGARAGKVQGLLPTPQDVPDPLQQDSHLGRLAPRDAWRYLGTSVDVTMREGGSWHQRCGGQGCCSTPHRAQDALMSQS